MDHVIGAFTRSISLGIAVTSEAIAGRKGPRRDDASKSQDTLDYTTLQQDLDDAGSVDETVAKGNQDVEDTTVEEISARFLSVNIPALPADFQLKPLSKTVILPQRRPRNRQRGFIRAYAPILGECAGIDQTTFINVISTWDRASKASPIFDVINIACFAVSFVPGTIPTAVGTVVGTAALIAQELQSRYRSNKYLEELNELLFKPRGLFAMVMVYKPDMSDEAILQADLADPTRVALLKHSDETVSSAKKMLRRLRGFSGKVPSDDFIPECAELVYPMLDDAVASQRLELPGIRAQSQSAVQDYLDRRAQDAWANKNRDSKLAKALPPASSNSGYVNRFCDPNHPVNSGSIFGLVTGGTFDPIAMGRVRRAKAAAKRKGQPPLSEQETHDAYMGRLVRDRVTGTPSKKIPIFEKIVRSDVLYFVVCNLPTEKERMEIRGMIASAGEEH